MPDSIIEENVNFPVGADVLSAFLVRPAAEGTFPAVVAIHEIFGLNDGMRAIARRFGREGYVCLAVDLFSVGNRIFCIAETIAAALKGPTSNIATTRLKSALDYLALQQSVDATKIGAIGFCMGGNFAISLSCEDNRIKTIAPFYATNPSLDNAAKLCPVVGSYPALDITAMSAKTLKKKLDEVNVINDIKVYDGALHSFMDSFYNREVSEDAWRRTMEFFSKHLVGSTS